MCVGPMGTSILERRRGGVGQWAGVVDRRHGTLGPCVVGVREYRCCRPWCVACLLWRGLGPPLEMSDGSKGFTPRGRPAAAKVNPGRGTGGWQSRRAERVAHAPSRCQCSARRKNGDGGNQWARRCTPAVEVAPAEQGGAEGEEALGRWSAMLRGSPVGGYLVGSRLKATRCYVQHDVLCSRSLGGRPGTKSGWAALGRWRS